MRHTLTLEPDVDAALAELSRTSGQSFKEVVNSVLRQGLLAKRTSRTAPPLVIEPLTMGVRPGISLVSTSQLESMLEEESLK